MEQLWRTFGNLIPIVLIVTPMLVVGWWALAVRRRGRQAAVQAYWTSGLDILIALFTLPVLYLVFVPIPGGVNNISLVPGSEVAKAFTYSSEAAVMQILGNLVLLTPLGFLVPLRTARMRSLTRVILGAALVSIAIEILQAVLGIGRISTVDDVILNTIGAFVGALLALLCLKLIGVRANENPVRATRSEGD
ncbi:VanZ family protein [Goodfellowiella coeruleoviolacea]|uniref:VanZ family protein n=1 Tax=Goodfellowiella coeruleoviolacea TaxID=334858 RepID=UPI0020A56F7E|nr:VanZ family protein [Goodfellowiella coeruleoviolacea]